MNTGISVSSAYVRSLFANQERWLQRLATGETNPSPGHPRLFHQGGGVAARTGRSGVICLHYPSPESNDVLPDFLAARAWLKHHGAADVLVWSARTRPDLTHTLLAHGLDTSFEPYWMVRILTEELAHTGADISVRLANARDIDDLHATPQIPYINSDLKPSLRALTIVPPDDQNVWLLVARDTRGVVGQAVVNLTGDVAGLYNVAVHQQARKRGIGTALTTAACNLALRHGARQISLNATPNGMRMYPSLGFEHVGDGQTWYLTANRLAHPPKRQDVDFAMAIVEGTLDSLENAVIPRALPNGDTPLAFAARTGRAESIRWLLDHGVRPEILPLWSMDFRDEAIALMSDQARVNQRIAPLGTTPLHGAVERGDAELVEVLIGAGADLTATDRRYNSTPLGWAIALGHEDIAARIRTAGGE